MLLKQTDSDSELLYSNVQGESIPFSIGDPSVIIDIIRKKIYSHPIRTMVQEYLSNAKDSCLEAGKDSSCIHVSLPTHLKPEFSIRDYGVGMSDERIREVFVQYGISTKRNSVSQLGYFGIGSKSGWAYTDSFIVESFYNGTHRQYIADIGDNKEGRLLLHNEVATDQENGVLIKIPVAPADAQEFHDSYVRATCFWKDRPQDTTVSYPSVVFNLNDDIKLYKVGMRYDKNNTLKPTVYFNANGIPFEAQGLHDRNTPSLHDLFEFCTKAHGSDNALLISIKVDPAKLGISANRESFSNQKYARTKLVEAYDKIMGYITNEFVTKKFSEYPSVYRNLDVLINFNHGFFNAKPYYIEKRWNEISLLLQKGYLSEMEYGTKYHKSIKNSVSLWHSDEFPHNIEVFLSRSKGILVRPKKGPVITPEFDKPTKKSIIRAKQQSLLDRSTAKQRSELKHTYVLFQDNMTDEEYQEIGEVAGATQYIEDYFSNVKPIKFQRPDKEPKEKGGKEKITVRKFEQGMKRDNKAVRGRSYITMDDPYIANYDGIFYGETCPLSFYRFINNPKYKFCAVYGGSNTLKKLEGLQNPKIVPIEGFSDFVINNPDMLQSYIDHWIVNSNKSTWEFLISVHKALVSQKFDLPDILSRACSFINNDLKANPQIFIKGMELKSELLDFLDAYPLLTKIKDYPPFPLNLYSHITFYMKSIDEDQIK